MQNTNKNKILKLYYEKHLRRKDIIKRLGLSGRYITTVIKQDSRYISERERRKLDSRARTVERHKKSRNKKIEEDYAIYEQMKNAHIQAIRDLSNNAPISNIAFRNWNNSIYRYREKDKTYRLKRNVITGYDVPKKIMWH